MIFIYNLFVKLYTLAIRIAAVWNAKAAAWIRGRQTLFKDLEAVLRKDARRIWIHCASAGEFEQGKPVIEMLKRDYPAIQVVVSFFSPSGFAAGKKYAGIVCCYLPVDTAANAKRFMELVQPELVVFIKYEYWYHHLHAAAFRHIPVLLVSAIFRKEAVFFKWYGGLHRQMLYFFRQLFVQDAASKALLAEHAINHCTIGGDTRFDRVQKIASQFSEIETVQRFVAAQPVLVAGSTWPADEQLLAAALDSQFKLIVAPHEINKAHMASIRQAFPGALLFSEASRLLQNEAEDGAGIWKNVNSQQQVDIARRISEARVLVIDNYGMLSKLYRYATIAYVGGGFNKSGIHNTLEAAVYGKPVVFGPQYKKFREAKELLAIGAAHSVSNAEGLKQLIANWREQPELLQKAGIAAAGYVADNTGPSEMVARYIQENRLLTN